MRKLRFICLFLFIPLLTQAQFAHKGYATSMGGGTATGAKFTSQVVAGDAAASETLGSSETMATYPGFIPAHFIILSFGLQKDSVILASIYQATAGDEWSGEIVGWLSSDDIASWTGVTVTNQRVTAIDLSGRNLQGNLPPVITSLSKLESIDVSNNELRKIPDLSGLPLLTSSNVSGNRLNFQDILRNTDLTGTYSYSPQKRYGVSQNDTVSAGTDHLLSSMVPGANAYQWIFDDFANAQDSVPVEGATTTDLMIAAVDYSKMGAYRLVATNSSLPDLVLQTRNRNVWATTTVQGKVYADAEGTLLTDGQVNVYRIANGPFILTDSSAISAIGEYKIEDLVLGDFILRSDPAASWPDVIQTYYVSTEDWVNADTLLVRNVVDNIDIQMVFKPDPDKDPLGGTINGAVETDLPDQTDGEGNARIEARRKVKKAGCSLRRRTRGSGGRDEQEDEFTLFAYVESDDEGKFTFPEIPEGVYRLNIQYPGVPMDETSDVEFTIGGDVQEQLFQVSATITENGIVVNSEEVLSVPKPYLKDINLYPNPTIGPVTVDYTVNRRIDDLRLEVRTVQGSLLSVHELENRMGAYRAQMDFSRQEAGVYFLIFTDHAGTFKQQVRVRRQ